ncbi:MAG: NADH:ubiquinone reductase (Na(+)-transporting) subunit D [Flavobacteriales bacterium]|nr:MAG: NADH:ubiquinone reductase (Na(+)-transporting) subunit D [Flavobacteriales bacterium]MBE7440974.1 NADH:ubiquinone reductase (Na(+)-transporting) subunit D [Flavobacteriales bacterium]MBX2959886.1 NADH:ubiquinone reductase (Na(+)-transporting) subunit D [Flavobacteriales bacterium]HRN40712.1 NADH:ubiquinone reductase (Na(+)-transporting) subunit D [Vicingus sp.]HRP59366.1 NADH:ubiquinone reductase (Na(+)-transporting) subunit D [Vicingus sp.]
MSEAKKESLFSKKNRKLITEPLNTINPVTIQVLGICSALAVTVQMDNALIMSIAVTAVTVLGNVVISLMRNIIPSRIRIIVELVVVAFLVICVDQILKAYVYDVSKSLSVFVGLIITNCIIMGRLEAFALGNKPWESALDGLGNGLGYGLVLIVVAFFKELFGSGSLSIPGLGKLELLPDAFFELGYMNNGLMLLPPSSLFIVAIYIWVQKSRNPQLIGE